MSEKPNLIMAKMRIEVLKGFYIHAGIYVLVNLLLITINVVSGDDVWWSLWALLGWGLGLFVHALFIFSPLSGMMVKWEQRKIAQLMQKD